MPNTHTIRPWRSMLLGAMACGLLGTGGVRAQGLDMDAGSAAKAPAAHQSGDLDMDVKPDAPLPPRPTTQAATGGNVQDGIAPLSGSATPGASPAPAMGAANTQAAPSPPPLVPAAPAVTPATVAEQPPAVAPEPVALDHPKVIDTAKLQSGETTVSLSGIEGLTGASAQALQGFLSTGDGHVTCQPQTTPGFVCVTADGTNVAQEALINGAAKTTQDAPDSYRKQEAAAQDARRGIWANLPPPPETVKHPVVQDTSTLFADGKTYALDGVVGFDDPYAGQMQGYIAANGDSVTCSPQNDLGNYVCLMPDGTDVAKVALVNGAARVGPDAPDPYRVQQLDALNNRRGYWATAPQAVIAAAMELPAPDVEYTLVAGDDGMDGISYIGGAPVALIDGEEEFLVYGDDDLGWGYYDHYHHWRGAPDRFRHHMDRFHPHGHGLRGGGHDAFHHDAATRGRAEAMHRDAAMHGREAAGMRGGARPGMAGREGAGMRGGARSAMGGREEGGMRGGARSAMGGREEGGMRGGARSAMGGREEGGMRGGATRSAMGGQMGRSGMGGQMGRPGMGGQMGRPGMAMAGGRSMGGMGGGFRPGGGMGGGMGRPGGMGGGMRAAPAMHASASRGGGGGGGRHK